MPLTLGKLTAIGTLATALVLASLAVPSGTAQEAESLSANADCSFNPAHQRTPREVWRAVSRTAELVAPSPVSAAAGSSRRRAVKQPPLGPQTYVTRNFIDTEIFEKMKRDGVRWTRPATDEEFLRRLYLDLTGQIPTAQKVKSYLADTASDKRDRLIDELLASPEFAERWTLWFGDHVGNVQVVPSTGVVLYAQGRNAYHNFILDSFKSNKPYDQLVRELLSGRGANFTSGAANYWVRQIQTNGPVQDTFDNLSADSGEKFLGLPLNCLSCHGGFGHLEQVNTGLVARTREDFWKNAAFFATEQHRRQPDANMRSEWVIEDAPAGRTGYRLNTNSGNKTARTATASQPSPVEPAFFLGGERPAAGEPRRQAYARILTAHPQFARASVNYIWKEIFGLGLVEPADSFDLLRQDPATIAPGARLQPTHPELLTRLANHFSGSGYNFRTLIKTIVSSSAYQLSSMYTEGEWSELYVPYYARHYPQRVLAESLTDAIVRATGVTQRYTVNGLTVERAMQLPDPTEPARGNAVAIFMNGFGRGDRDSTPRTREGSIVQALSMINDNFVVSRVKNTTAGSHVQRLLAATRDPGTIVEELYIATLSRRPTPQERAAAVALLSSGDLVRKTEDLQFALLNRLEFLYY